MRLDDGCEKFLNKMRQFQNENEKIKRKFIPANVRKLLRRKDKLSKIILATNDQSKIYKTQLTGALYLDYKDGLLSDFNLVKIFTN